MPQTPDFDPIRDTLTQLAAEIRAAGADGLNDYYLDGDARQMLEWADTLDALLASWPTPAATAPADSALDPVAQRGTEGATRD